MSATIDFGIDLGTTNSCVARWQDGGVRIFQNNDQMNVTPSAIFINRSGRKIVGLRAYSALRTDPENVATEFKRWMGQKDKKEFVAAKVSLSAEELSAEILKSLREDVRRQTGTDMTTAVITVPAAFGTLQCEATARAAQLAGIVEAPLLQEPIAAAIGYGVKTESADQRWLVFDLGGGTLDIAVVSTREGRLHVLEHLGNNLRGGKDIDRLIVDKVLLPAIAQQFDLRSRMADGKIRPLLQRLRSEAERAKIELSSDTRVSISLFDLGEDDSGKPIELEAELTRTQVESLMEPVVDECLALAKSALAAARIGGSDLDRILLVGGPTQMPIMRARLAQELGAPIDLSLDPMTVVAKGAAIYATTLERSSATVVVPALHGVSLKLVYEPVSVDLTCAVAGKVSTVMPGMEVKFDADGGFWTSGWVALKEDFFETNLQLKADDVTGFKVYLRDGQGHLIETDSPELKVRHGLVPSAPPLPHSISVEVVSPTGQPRLDIVFPKGTPLPADKEVKYRTTRVLVPGKSETTIYIKLWEGEFLDAPDANQFVGNLTLRHDGVERRLPEGSEVEVAIAINTSRLITVKAFVPYLNQYFSKLVYVPERDEEDLKKLAKQVPGEVREYIEELEKLSAAAPSDPAVEQQVQDLQSKLLDLEVKVGFPLVQASGDDPEEDKRIVAESRSVRGLLERVRHQIMQSSSAPDTFVMLKKVQAAVEVIERYGSSSEKEALPSLRRTLDQALSRRDDRSVQKIVQEFEELEYLILSRQDWFWLDWFKHLSAGGEPFVNRTEAKRLIMEGHAAVKGGDSSKLKMVVGSLWRLQPKGEGEESFERGKPVTIKVS